MAQIRASRLPLIVFFCTVALSAFADSRLVVPLSGPWEFHPGAYLEGDDPLWTTTNLRVNLPASWNALSWPGKPAGSADGIGTYRIHLNIDGHDGPWAVDWSIAGSAARIWWKGALVHQAGVPGLNPRTEVPGNSPSLIPLDSGSAWLVVQVSNFSHVNGGLWAPLHFGPFQDLLAQKQRADAIDWFLAGILFLVGLLALGLSAFMRWHRASLWLGLLGVVFAVVVVFNHQLVIFQFIPDLDWEWFNKIQNYGLYVIPFLLVQFVRVILPQKLPRYFVPLVSTLSAVGVLFVTLAPFRWYGNFLYGAVALILAAAFFTFRHLLQFFATKKRIALVCMIGIGGLALAGVANLIQYRFFLSMPTMLLPAMPIALLCFGLAVGTQLSRRKQDFDQAVRLDTAVMFANLQSFGTATDGMKPEEIFRLVNGFLGAMGPIIRKHGGYVDTYQGDGVLALFPRGSSSAVDAALEMHQAFDSLNIHNRAQGLPELTMGIGMHRGEVLVGAIGELEKMDSSPISPVLSIANHLESLAGDYEARIIVSPAIIMDLRADDSVEHRFLGFEQIKDFDYPLPVYEIFSADAEEIRDQKRQSKAELEDALIFFGKREFERATTLLKDLHQRYPNDPASLTYLNRIRSIQERRLLYRLRKPHAQGTSSDPQK